MITKKTHSVFNFCSRWNVQLARMAVQRKNCRARICYVTTQSYRMYLVADPKGVHYAPYVRGEHQWSAVSLRERVTAPDPEAIFKTYDTLVQTMTSDFFTQFPHAEECFYDILPTAVEVERVLKKKPTGAALSENFYLFVRDDDCGVEDADGIISILVDEGTYMLPFSIPDNPALQEIMLQPERGKLHPDSVAAQISNAFWGGFDAFFSGIASLFSWSRFRRFIDRVVQ